MRAVTNLLGHKPLGMVKRPFTPKLNLARNVFLSVMLCAACLASFLSPAPAHAYTANKVSFEVRPEGIWRVHVHYTVPSLREFRSASVDFRSRREAEAYYWDLVQGADFHLPGKPDRRFTGPSKPSPW